VYLGHLREARELARKSVLWFLESLSNLDQNLDQDLASNVPTREEVIAAIDVFADGKLKPVNVQSVMSFFSTSGVAQNESDEN
jgi:hypothetical protein